MPRSRRWLVPLVSLALSLAWRPGLAFAQPTEAPRAEPFPSLERAVSLAKTSGPRATVARADANAARSSLVGARLSPVDNPYLELFFDRAVEPNVTRDVALSSNLWVPVEVAGQRDTRIAEAQALIRWRSQAAQSAYASAAAQTVQAYGRTLVANERARVLEEVVALAREEEALYAARLAAGDATEVDAKLATLERARTEVLAAEAKADLTRAITELGTATGTRFEAPDAALAPQAPAPSAKAPASAPEAVAQRSPGVMAAQNEADYLRASRERAGREALPAVSFILSVGRGDLGETRLGGGIAWTFPVLRANQGEMARADAERQRALAERDALLRVSTVSLDGLARERSSVRAAVSALEAAAEPAAQGAVDAAVATAAAGKAELLRVLTARRDQLVLRTKKLELLEREWKLVADHVELAGDLP